MPRLSLWVNGKELYKHEDRRVLESKQRELQEEGATCEIRASEPVPSWPKRPSPWDPSRDPKSAAKSIKRAAKKEEPAAALDEIRRREAKVFETRARFLARRPEMSRLRWQK